GVGCEEKSPVCAGQLPLPKPAVAPPRWGGHSCPGRRMTNVLVVTSMYPPHHYGGYELSCRDVVRRFRAAGHDVTVLTTNLRIADAQATPDADGERDDGVVRDLDWYWADHALRRPKLRKCLAMERRNQAVLEAVQGRARPDVVAIGQIGA